VANLVDTICDNLRLKVATISGYRDAEAQVPHLTRMLRDAGTTSSSLSFGEFSLMLTKLNVRNVDGPPPITTVEHLSLRHR